MGITRILADGDAVRTENRAAMRGTHKKKQQQNKPPKTWGGGIVRVGWWMVRAGWSDVSG